MPMSHVPAQHMPRPPSSTNLLEAATEWARLHEGEARSPKRGRQVTIIRGSSRRKLSNQTEQKNT